MIELGRPWPECRVHLRPVDPAHAAPIGDLAASGLSVNSSAM
ncbi:MAG: hypothetical protein QOJ11_190 [Frankiales bacterium]|jgi:hypothetical protein|nr:hypothetical protein [Frankiales bacterium]